MARHAGATPQLAACDREQPTPRQTNRSARVEASQETSQATVTDEGWLATATRRGSQEMAEGRRDDARGAVLVARNAGATPQLAAREGANRRHDRPTEAPEPKRVDRRRERQ